MYANHTAVHYRIEIMYACFTCMTMNAKQNSEYVIITLQENKEIYLLF